MVSLQDLLDLRTADLHSAADAWQGMADQVAAHGSAFQEVGTGMSTGWTGTAATAAQAHVATVGAQFPQHEQHLRAVSEVLRTGATNLAGAQTALNKTLNAAQHYGLDISSDGSVSANPAKMLATGVNPAEMDAMPQVTDRISGSIKQILDYATQADQQMADGLRQHTSALNVSPAADVTTMMAPEVVQEPGGGDDPAASGRTAADLINNGAPVPWDQVQTLLDEFPNNPAFGTAFFTELGDPSRALWLVGELAKDGTDDPAMTAQLGDIQKQLGGDLAAATDSSQTPNLGNGYLTQLMAAGQQKINIDDAYQPYGYQLLGVLMHNGTYSSDFLNQVGGNMLAFEQNGGGSQVWYANRPEPGNGIKLNLVDSQGAGFDPMTGLMGAFAKNKQAGEQFFDPTTDTPLGQPITNPTLEYLVGKRAWFPDALPGTSVGDQSPGQTNLASALQTATTGGTHSPTDANIVSQTVHILATDRGGTVPPAMQNGVANILGSYIGDVNYAHTQGVDQTGQLSQGFDLHDDPAIPNSPDAHAVFNKQELDQVLGSAASDKNGFVTLNNSERAYAALKLHADLTTPGQTLEQQRNAVQADGTLSGNVLGTINQHYVAAINSQQQSQIDAWNNVIKARGAAANFVIGKLPGIGGLATQGSEAYVNALVSGSEGKVGAAPAQNLVNQYYGGAQSAGDLVLTSLWNNQAFPAQDAPTPHTYPDLFDSSGHVLPLDQIMANPNSNAHSEFNQWLNEGTGKDAFGTILNSVDSGYNIGWTEPTVSDQKPSV